VPFRFSDAATAQMRRAPKLGEHTADILGPMTAGASSSQAASGGD
jgi:crotonobetainyl-CoA:carnitine CoA-transferase CaiB-like acyl-CoA transferase